MKIEFCNSMKVYRDYVNNPDDRKALRKFCKEFSAEIAEEAVNRHKLLKFYPTKEVFVLAWRHGRPI